MQTKSIPPELLAQLLSEKFQNRFWSHVDRRGENECWPWRKGVDTHGYGQTSLTINGNRNIFLSHRLVWAFANRREPPSGFLVIHSCVSNRRCCNPAHLRIGTHQDNSNDAKNQGHNGKPS